MDISRRALLVGIGAAPFAPLVLRAQPRPARPKLAAICTTYCKYSHAQPIVDRFLEGYGWNGTPSPGDGPGVDGGSDIMDDHGMEAMQCMLERRKGGETGVRAVRMVEGPRSGS